MSEKIYCGNAKRIGANGAKLSINLTKIPREWIKEDKNGNSWLNLAMWPRNEDLSPDQYGNHYSITVDTWKPENKTEQKSERLSNDLLGF